MGVRARIIDRLTEAIRAPRDVARLRAECERLRAALSEAPAGVCCMSCDRDDRRHGARSVVVASPACDACLLRWAESELVRVRAERDARIPTDIDGARKWAEQHGVWVQYNDDYELWQVLLLDEWHDDHRTVESAVFAAVQNVLYLLWIDRDGDRA